MLETRGLMYTSSSPLQLPHSPILDVLKKDLSPIQGLLHRLQLRVQVWDVRLVHLQMHSISVCFWLLSSSCVFSWFWHLYIWHVVWSDPPTHFEEVGPSRSAAGSVLRSPAHNCEFTDFKMREESKSSINSNWDPQRHLREGIQKKKSNFFRK